MDCNSLIYFILFVAFVGISQLRIFSRFFIITNSNILIKKHILCLHHPFCSDPSTKKRMLSKWNIFNFGRMTKKIYETIFQFPQFYVLFFLLCCSKCRIFYGINNYSFFMLGNCATQGNKIPAVFGWNCIHCDVIHKESLLKEIYYGDSW